MTQLTQTMLNDLRVLLIAFNEPENHAEINRLCDNISDKLKPEPTEEERALDNLLQEVSNLMAWETQDARQRGKTAEGRTVTALYYAAKKVESLRNKNNEANSNDKS